MIARGDVAYLCRRAGFGATSSELDTLSAQPSIDALVDTIVGDPRNFGPIKPSPSMPSAGSPGKKPDAAMEKIGRWYLQRMTDARFVVSNAKSKVASPLREKMILFWHGLLVSSVTKPEVADRHPTLAGQHALFRNLALDDFQNLIAQTSRDPAMLIYLDNWISTADNPNENFAREVQELMTIGVGNYTQDDVVAAARAGTGYTLTDSKKSTFVFNPDDHDDGQKTFYGVTANWDLLGNAGNSGGHDVLPYICTNKQSLVATFVGKAMWQYFASFAPSATTLADVAAGFTQSGQLSISDALKTIFKHPDFWATPARTGKVKNPVEWVVTSMKALSITKLPSYHYGTDPVNDNMGPMGMMLFNQPNVSGWWHKPETRWIGFPAFAAKVDALDAMLDVALKNKKNPLWSLASQPADTAVDNAFGLWGVDPTTAGPSRARAIDMVNAQIADNISTYWRVRNIARVIALSPDAQAN